MISPPWVQVFQFHACPGFNGQKRGKNGSGNVDKKSNEEAKNLVIRFTWVRGQGSTDKCSLEDGISSDISCGKQDVWLGKGVLWSSIFEAIFYGGEDANIKLEVRQR